MLPGLCQREMNLIACLTHQLSCLKWLWQSWIQHYTVFHNSKTHFLKPFNLFSNTNFEVNTQNPWISCKTEQLLNNSKPNTFCSLPQFFFFLLFCFVLSGSHKTLHRKPRGADWFLEVGGRKCQTNVFT